MTEDDLLKAVIDMAKLFGVTVAHFRPAQLKDAHGKARWVTAVQGDGKGYPDLTLVHRHGGVMWRELKSGVGRHSPEQVVWLAELKAAGQDAGTWRPVDLTSGRIESELRALAGRKPSRNQPARAPQTGTATVRSASR